MKLGLGTVQFGLDYGVSNRNGKTPPHEVRRMLEMAAANGIRILDTAAIYGESEAILGALLPQRHPFEVITKLPSLLAGPKRRFEPAEADRLLERSLARLRCDAVHGLLLHRPDDLLSAWGDEVMDWLMRIKGEGRAGKIGVSVYAEDDLDSLMSRYPLDLIQAPVNVFDQRLVQSGALQRCRNRGAEIHVRSVFLQGLLLMEPSELPAYFHRYADRLAKFGQFARQQGLAPAAAALAYVRNLPEADAIIVGANDHVQLLQLIDAFGQSPDGLDFAPFAETDPALLNPSRWVLEPSVAT
jgi:aryl-alcohol dehydrogenase-like predicted oxidoreductase